MAQYDSAIAVAQRLIKKFGRQVALYQLVSTPADVNKPWQGAGTPAQGLIVFRNAVFLPLSGLADLGIQLTDEELTLCANEAILVPFGTDADVGDGTFFGCIDDPNGNGPRFNFLWIKILKPGPQIVMYAMGIKR